MHFLLLVVLIYLGANFFTAPGNAATPISLGTAGSYGILAESGISNSGTTTIAGNQGSSPVSTYSGFSKVTTSGSTHLGDSAAAQAQVDARLAYKNLVSIPSPLLNSSDLGGQVLVPGTYTTTSDIGVTGVLTLDAGGDESAVFVFQTTANLIMAASSLVKVINGGFQCNIYWQIGNSANLGASSTIVGSILSVSNINVATSATIFGHLLSLEGAISLESDLIAAPTCNAILLTTNTVAPGPRASFQVRIWPKGYVNTGDGSLEKY